MAYPIVEQISQAIKAKLETITSTSIVEVVRPTREGGYTAQDSIVVLTQDDPTKDSESMNQVQITWIQPYYVDYYAKPSDRSTTPIDTICNQARADIEKALMSDKTWGGLAMDTVIESPEGFVTPDGAFEGVRVNVSVTYRTLETDPYSTGD